jgi:hypothetical protein
MVRDADVRIPVYLSLVHQAQLLPQRSHILITKISIMMHLTTILLIYLYIMRFISLAFPIMENHVNIIRRHDGFKSYDGLID